MTAFSLRFNFRRGNSTDIAQIKELTWLAYSQYADVISKSTLQEWQTNLSSEKTYADLLKISDCFVCEYESKIIGSIFLIPQGNPSKLFSLA